MARFGFCFSSSSICKIVVGKMMTVKLRPSSVEVLVVVLLTFNPSTPFAAGNKAARRAYLRQSLFWILLLSFFAAFLEEESSFLLEMVGIEKY